MRKSFFVILLFSIFFAQAQDSQNTKIIDSEINEVTVFLEGAQITRHAEVQVNSGKTTLRFTNLSPFIRTNTVQVRSSGNITVLSVNHANNQLEKLEKSSALMELEKRWKELSEEIELEKAHIEILREETSFLKENKNIGGKNQALNVNDLRTTSDFYSERLTQLKLTEIKRRNNLSQLEADIQDIEDQIRNLTSTDKYAMGEVHVKIDAKSSVNSSLVLTYLVDNAGWNPSYDIRAKNVNEPIELVYKANVRQDTKVDWKNVNLTFSSVDPSTSGIAPELKTYYLDYNSLPPTYGNTVSEVSGYVFDSERLPLPGASVRIKGTSIGTQTNFDGYYSLTVPDSDSQLEYSFIGFITQTRAARKKTQNVYLAADSQTLDEVVVTSLGISREKKSLGYATQNVDESTIPMTSVENQTSFEFKVDQAYSIKSDNQSFTVDMNRYQLPATYEYYSVPKIEKAVYLMASVVDWQKYKMLEGEANLFFENTFVGKTILDTRYSSDTLEISLGQDKNVRIERELISDFSSKKMVGTRKEESREWKISVRNNKSEQIKLLLLDQIPISKTDEIKVEMEDRSGGKIDSETGEVSWKMTVDSNDQKEVKLRYTVKYPKSRSLHIE